MVAASFREKGNVEINFIDGDELGIKRDGVSSVTLCFRDGSRISGVRPRCLLPLTRPHSYIRFLDREEAEIGILREMGDLDPGARSELKAVLKRYYIIPVIKKINRLTEEYGITRWGVETDRGPRVFEVRNRSTDIQIIHSRTVLIKDSDDNRYKIPDYNDLPYRSRLLLYGEI